MISPSRLSKIVMVPVVTITTVLVQALGFHSLGAFLSPEKMSMF